MSKRAGLLLAGAMAAVMAVMPALAHAGEEPLYQPAPSWVVPAGADDAAKLSDGDHKVLSDVQMRFTDGVRWGYFATMTRMSSAEMLAQNATVTLPWVPDKGDLIIHDLSILRDGKRIDLIAAGQKFTVLRREENLEARELTGVLSATLAIPGLQVGDVLRLAASITARDAALGGRVQWAAPLMAAPFPAAPATMRLSWPTAQPVKWKLLAEGATTIAGQQGDVSELTLAVPLPRQAEIPADAPERLRHQPLIEVSSFADWADVSRSMARLYATEGTIAPGSALAGEVSAIMAAHADPLSRAAAALQMVEDKVRYLAVQMNGGNYQPQSPARTWEVRYGDCKAKTLLLLAMLRRMDISAEPVMANIGLDDLIPDRLPSVQAFNHVFVRATIAGQSIWLDGTRSGDRLADIHDTPILAHVLPVRLDGAALETIARHAPARPAIDLTVALDASASADLLTPAEVTLVLHGALAERVGQGAAAAGLRQQRQFIGEILPTLVGPGLFSGGTIKLDATNGTAVIVSHAVFDGGWAMEDRRLKRGLSKIPRLISFAPDRARPAWAAIPVATGEPNLFAYHLRMKLPEGGRGIAVDGDQMLDTTLAGEAVMRRLAVAGGMLTLDETVASDGMEVAASAIPAIRDRVTTVNARAPRLIAPGDARRSWELADAEAASAAQVKGVEAVFATAIADAEPGDTYALQARASFRLAIADRAGALADWARVIATAPTAEAYVARATIEEARGDLTAARSDAAAARRLDPSAEAAVKLAADLAARGGDVTAATGLLDERIALGGETRAAYARERASIIGTYGDPQAGIGAFDALIAERPGTPSLLNARCWVKATRDVMLDSALKDCTSAIELSDSPAQVLDSRAVVWLRLGKYDEGLRDIDSALAQAPDMGPSHFVRAILLTRLGRGAEAAHDLAIARRLSPEVEADYARFGLRP